MLLVQFSADDLVNTRFAFSPLWEAVKSYLVLRDSSRCRSALHLPWIREAQAIVKGLDTSLIDALLIYPLAEPKQRNYADFLAPFPNTIMPDFYAEIGALRTTSASEVRRDIQRNYGTQPHATLKPFLVDPEDAMHRLAEQLTAYWQKTLEPHWSRLKGLLEADVLYRAQILALNGPDALLGSLGEKFTYQDRQLMIDKFADKKVSLAGHGLVLIPSIFSSGAGSTLLPCREVVQYQVRGVALAWSTGLDAAGDAFTTLLGAPRAALVKRLVIPATTGELAELFGVTPGAISQQLNWLRQAGLVMTQRRGRRVYHELSMIGRAMLESYGELDATDHKLPLAV